MCVCVFVPYKIIRNGFLLGHVIHKTENSGHHRHPGRRSIVKKSLGEMLVFWRFSKKKKNVELAKTERNSKTERENG